MPDDDHPQDDRPRRREWWVVVGLGLAVVLAAAAFAATTTVFVGSDTTVQTGGGVTVTLANDTELASGTPFVNGSLEIDGQRVIGSGGTVTLAEANASVDGRLRTELSVSNVPSGELVGVNRSDALPVVVNGTVDSLTALENTTSTTAGQADLRAAAGGEWALVLRDTGTAAGEQLIAIDPDLNQIVGSTTVNADGDAAFTGLSAFSGGLDIREGVAELKVFRETEPSVPVDGVTLRIRFFQSGTETVIERTVTDGTVSLSGVPNDRPLVITIKDGADYEFRRIYTTNLFEQSTAYLLRTASADVTPAEVTFALDDRTGQFPSTSVLQIRKPLTKDYDGDGTNETQYRTITGGQFGAGEEITTTLAVDERYRLIIQNQDGARRVIGSFVPKGDTFKTLRIGRVEVSADGDKSYGAELETMQTDSDGDGEQEQFVRAEFVGGEDRIEGIDWTIETRDGGDIIARDSAPGPIGEYVATYQVNESRAFEDTTFVLNWNAERELPTGEDVQVSAKEYAGDVPAIAQLWPIDSKWLSLLGYLTIIASGGLIVIADASLAAMGMTVVGAFLTIIGAVGIPWPALGLAGAVSVLNLFGRER